MMNMGGPQTLDDVEFFLTNLFTDPEIIPMGKVQKWVGPYVAKRRTPKIIEQYRQVGGGSPIRKWTDVQGEGMVALLDEMSPTTAPHKHYVAFRYADPLTESVLDEMKADGVTRAVAFSQYPHWSCTTSGSSFNHLWRSLKAKNMEEDIKWSIIDRWYLAPGFIRALTERIEEALPQFDQPPVIVFSAHSLPQKVVSRGDPYANEIAATAGAVMDQLTQILGKRLPHILAWQSKVGPLPWLKPSTQDTLTSLGARGQKDVLVVPIAFTSDHIETLFEIDIEYKEVAEEAGVSNFRRTESLNASPTLIQTQADLVASMLNPVEGEGKNHYSPQYPLQCVNCANPTICRGMVNPAYPM
jgi:ferrochelatase